MKLPSLTTKAIRAWVLALPPDEPCGWRSDPQHCLVANYICADLDAQRMPHYTVTVGAQRIDVTVWDEHWRKIDSSRRTPSLALARMINAFDELPLQYPKPADVLPLLKEKP